ncbi:MAG TPA: DUF2079 domain-containing protein, partial [Bacteroidales bacterium]|nr:DUF2079 domain-containing protein [Bacteroidales bacterium]
MILLLLAVILFTSIYTIQVVWNHHCFRTYALDYGFYNQAIWDFAHFRSNTNTILEPPLPNYFQVHPGFTLIWILPLYWIFYPLFGSYTLLIIQNIFIIAGGLATYALIRRKTNDRWIALLAFLHFNLIWGHYSALAADYIDTTIASSLVPLFILMFDKRKYFAATVVFLFVITCKENMPIWLFFISAALFFIYRERPSRIASLGFGFFSIIYFIFIFTVLIPYFEDPHRPYGFFQYSALGDNPAKAVLYILKHPGASLKMLFENHLNDPNLKGIKLEFHTVFMLSGGLLLIRRPVYFLMFIPVIAQKMYNDSFVRWGILGFYSIEAV